MASSAEQLAELQRRRAAGELSPYDFDLNFLFMLNEADGALKRADLDHSTGVQAVVLSKDDFDALGAITFIHAKHGEMTIGSDSLAEGGTLVIFPEEVGS